MDGPGKTILYSYNYLSCMHTTENALSSGVGLSLSTADRLPLCSNLAATWLPRPRGPSEAN